MADENYIDFIKKDNNEGIEIKGKDMVKLNAPFVYLSDDTPLLTTAQDLAGAINELFQGGSGGGDEADYTAWQNLTEPEKHQSIMIVRVFNEDNRTATILIQRSCYGVDGSKTFFNWTINWGDGTIENIDATSKNSFNHTYSALGDYIVIASCNDNIPEGYVTSAIIGNHSNIFSPYMVAAKWGTFGTMGLSDFAYLKYIKINLSTVYSLGFQNDISLKQVIAKVNLKESCFSGCANLKFDMIEFNAVSEVPNYSFDGCIYLTDVNFPDCTKIENHAFRNCINLQSAEFAENCAISSGAFTGCAKLYPHPDGTTY